MKSLKSLVLGSIVLLITTVVINIVLSHTSVSESLLSEDNELLMAEDSFAMGELRKYLDCEITGAEVLACIRTMGNKYSFDVYFSNAEGGFIKKTISSVNEYLEPMNQVNNGTFSSKIQNESDKAWIDSAVKYYATYKKAGNSIVGLNFIPLDGESPKYNYTGNTMFSSFSALEELKGNYEKLGKLQVALDGKLSEVEGLSSEIDFENNPFTSRIESLYYNYSKIYLYYGVYVDDKWQTKDVNERMEILSNNTNLQAFSFFLGGSDVNDYVYTNLSDARVLQIHDLAKPTETDDSSGLSGYLYETYGISGSSSVYVPQSFATETSYRSATNNLAGWELRRCEKNNLDQFKLSNGSAYKFKDYDESLKTIGTHFSVEYPEGIKDCLNKALGKMSSVDKEWNRWTDSDREALVNARAYLVDAREKIKSYYDSYVNCRKSCEALRDKNTLPDCVQTLYYNSYYKVNTEDNELLDQVKQVDKLSAEIINIDRHVGFTITNSSVETETFFGKGDNGYLGTALVVMNKSVDVSALRGTSSADNDYKDIIDNAIKEIDSLLAREVN